MSDHLGTRIQAPVPPGELLMGVPGYTFELGFMVRQGPGVAAGVPGSAAEFMWGGRGWYLLLGRSPGGTGGRVHDPGSGPEPRALPPVH
jgi:hypothetical protein